MTPSGGDARLTVRLDHFRGATTMVCREKGGHGGIGVLGVPRKGMHAFIPLHAPVVFAILDKVPDPKPSGFWLDIDLPHVLHGLVPMATSLRGRHRKP